MQRQLGLLQTRMGRRYIFPYDSAMDSKVQLIATAVEEQHIPEVVRVS